MSSSTRKKLIVTCICLAVAAMHLLTGPNYRGPFRPFVTGYLIDIVLPFALVLLFGLAADEMRWGFRPVLRWALVFGIGASVEICQFLGIPLFGKTFDPIDFLAYAGGAGLGLLFETRVFFGSPPSQCA